jgi:uncharacterized protein (DUF1697 family)
MGRRIGLLRAVNVGGRKVPMAELRALCAELGWTDIATYIQSGNIVFTAAGTDAAIEAALEKAIKGKFGMEVPVIVRTASQWERLASDNPFAAAAKDEPNRLMLLLSKQPPAIGAEDDIQGRAKGGEIVRRAGEALWIHFPRGQADSKLTPSAIDKAVGSPATGRNCNTVIKLLEMVRE